MDINHTIQEASKWVFEMTWRALGASLIVVTGIFLASTIERISMHFRRRIAFGRRKERSVYLSTGVLALTVILALSALGVSQTGIGIIVSASLALGSFGDGFYGLRIFSEGLFHVGDEIELADEGIIGRVNRISLTTTTFETEDGRTVTVPNKRLLGRALISHVFSGAKLLKFDLTLDPVVDVDAVIQTVEAVAVSVLAAGAYSAFAAEVRKIKGTAISCVVEFRVPIPQSRAVSSNFMKSAKKYFDDQGVTVVTLSVKSLR